MVNPLVEILVKFGETRSIEGEEVFEIEEIGKSLFHSLFHSTFLARFFKP